MIENVSNHLKLTQKVASTSNLQSNNKGVIIDTNQQSKTFGKQTGNIFNKLPTNIPSLETVPLVFKTKVNNHFLDQALAKKL